ncbi:MAG: trypsin-like peptidase domain-containing protein [Bdellovibrionota bacterium]
MAEVFFKSNKVVHFMKARMKNVVVAGVSVAALFGVVSAGVLIFSPQQLSRVKEFVTAQASPDYKLPAPALQTTPAVGADVAFLKSFSKIFANLAKEARPALIMIMSEKKVATQQQVFPEDFFFPFMPPQFGGPGNPKKKRPQGLETDAGSGFIVDLKNGYAVTNNHMIEDAEKITVTTFDNHKYKAKVIGTAKSLDIAVLKIEDLKATEQLKQLSLADSDKVDVGDWVIALGAPFELPQTLTMGVVSAVKRSGDVLGLNGPNSFIQIDAAINPGNSGGPLVSLEGQAIGMNTAIYSKNGTNVGIGFSIPSNTIRLVADSIINNGKLTQSYLGIELYDVAKFSSSALKEMKIDANTEGGLVMRVIPGSPAAKAGLQPYDIIQTANGAPVKSPSDIQAQIMFLKPGTTVKIGVLRNGKELTLTATVTEIPLNASDKIDKSGKPHSNKEKSLLSDYGIYLSEEKNKNGKGVKIDKVAPGSVADMAGLQTGDSILQVNKKPVSSPDDVEDILEKAKKSDINTAFLLVDRDGSQSAIILQVQ